MVALQFSFWGFYGRRAVLPVFWWDLFDRRQRPQWGWGLSGLRGGSLGLARIVVRLIRVVTPLLPTTPSYTREDSLEVPALLRLELPRSRRPHAGRCPSREYA